MTLPKIWPKQEKKEPEYFVRFFPGGVYDDKMDLTIIAAIVDIDGEIVTGGRLLAQGKGRMPCVDIQYAKKAGVKLDRFGKWDERQCFDMLFSVCSIVEER